MRASLLALVATAGLAACGGDDSGSTAPTNVEGADVTVVARDIEYTEAVYGASAGEITIALQNKGAIAHDIHIEGVEEDFAILAAPGDTETGTITLEPGTYTLYCSIPGHDAMKAKLEVS